MDGLLFGGRTGFLLPRSTRTADGGNRGAPDGSAPPRRRATVACAACRRPDFGSPAETGGSARISPLVRFEEVPLHARAGRFPGSFAVRHLAGLYAALLPGQTMNVNREDHDGTGRRRMKRMGWRFGGVIPVVVLLAVSPLAAVEIAPLPHRAIDAIDGGVPAEPPVTDGNGQERPPRRWTALVPHPAAKGPHPPREERRRRSPHPSRFPLPGPRARYPSFRLLPRRRYLPYRLPPCCFRPLLPSPRRAFRRRPWGAVPGPSSSSTTRTSTR